MAAVTTLVMVRDLPGAEPQCLVTGHLSSGGTVLVLSYTETLYTPPRNTPPEQGISTTSLKLINMVWSKIWPSLYYAFQTQFIITPNPTLISCNISKNPKELYPMITNFSICSTWQFHLFKITYKSQWSYNINVSYEMIE